MVELEIRRVKLEDEPQWRELWNGYNRFYKRTVEARTTDRLWSNLFAESGQPFGFVAAYSRTVVGFAHYFFMPSTSDWAPRCYMQDLFADPVVRGRGVGRALIEAIYAAADEQKAAQTYWLTAESNTDARRLYARVATLTPFIKYMR